MSKEKLTVENTVNKIQLKVFINTAELYSPHKQGEKELKNLLKQIRDEYEDINNGMSHDEIEKRIKTLKMFDKYLNEKGGK